VAFTILAGLPDTEEFKTMVRILESTDGELTLEKVEKQLHMEHLTRKEYSQKRKLAESQKALYTQADVVKAAEFKRRKTLCAFCQGNHATKQVLA
jgi:hypothetical protein